MNKGSLQRVAAFAACATVGALVPVLGATSASAAEPTALTASPRVVYLSSTGTEARFEVTLNNGVAANDVYAFVASGPDAPGAPVVCTTAGDLPSATYICTVDAGTGGRGTDIVRFFYDANTTGGAGTYQLGEPTTTASVIIAGTVAEVSLTPTTANVAQGQYQEYTVVARDIDGRPIPGAQVTVSAVDGTTSIGTDTDVRKTDPGLASFSGVGTSSTVVTTADGTGAQPAGSAKVWVASTPAGTVALTATPVGGTGDNPSGRATLTVNPGGANSVTSVIVSPATQNGFIDRPVTVTVTLRNAQGNPIAGVTPIVQVTGGPSAPRNLTVTRATDSTGSTTATYTAGGTTGTDTVQAFVDRTDGTNNRAGILDPGERSGTASVVLSVRPNFDTPGGLSNTGDFSVPSDTTSVPVTFTLRTANGDAAAGYQISFSTTGLTGSTVSPTTAVTDAQGRVSTTVTNPAPNAGDSVMVRASLVGDSTVTSDLTVTWAVRAATRVVITPQADTKPTKGTTTHTVTTLDQFGDPVTGVTYVWTVSGNRNNEINNAGATGTGTSFTYTDMGSATQAGTDLISVTAFNATGNSIGFGEANQYWVVGTGQTAQANIDLVGEDGYYQRNASGSYLPVDFDKTSTAGVTAAGDTGAVETVAVKLADINGNPLYGKSVTFTSTGVGVFTDVNGKPIGNTTTATVADADTGMGTFDGYATVYVRSTQVGTQTITAAVDGITDSATIIYSGQYVPMTPRRVLDTRTGQGGLIGDSGAPVSRGRLAQNTLYYFDLNTADVPGDAAAYAFNVTSIKPDSAGNLRVAPGCSWQKDLPPVPSTSLINYQPRKDVANFVVIPNRGDCNSLAIYSDSATVAVAIDIAGYYPNMDESENIVPVDPPKRIADTRTGLGGSTGMIAAGTNREFQIAGRGGVALDAKSVALNVTAISPTRVGNMRVYPDGAAVPNASNINYIVRQDKSAFVIVDLPANGKIRIYSDYGSANVAIDAFDFYPVTSNLVTSVPTRILDTRTTGTIAANSVVRFQVGGRGGVPTDAQAVLVSVTGIHTATSSGYGNLRVYPAGMGVPNVSNLNYVSKTSDVANFSIVRLGTNGQLSLYSDSSPINVAVDVVGYVAAGK